MNGATITVDDDEVLAALSKLIAAAGDMRPALKNIGEEMEASTKARIKAERTPAGAPFAPLNPLYAATKKGPGILRETSSQTSLVNSIVYQLAGDDAVQVGTDNLYARVHQFGATILPKNGAALVFSLGAKKITVASVDIPARPFLGVSDEDREEIVAAIEYFLAKAIGQSAD